MTLFHADTSTSAIVLRMPKEYVASFNVTVGEFPLQGNATEIQRPKVGYFQILLKIFSPTTTPSAPSINK
jgi:hypothetical protein